jgi:hypothetical protein
MDTKQTADAIKVMQAYVDGAEIQERVVSGGPHRWKEAGPYWNWMTSEYRIKPQPREWWINRYPGGGIGIYDSKELAEINKSLECIHVREVTE